MHTSTDTLDQLIRLMQLTDSRHIHCQLSDDWYLHHAQHQGQGLVHIVTQGQGFLRLHNGTIQQITQGDVIFFPMITEHSLSNQAQCSNIEHHILHQQQGAFTYKYQGDKPNIQLFCIQFFYDQSAQIMQHLPECIHLKLDYPPLKSLIHLFEIESQQTHSEGQHSILNALSAVLLVQLMRAYLHHYQHDLKGIFYSLNHPRLGTLIHQLIQNPEQDWTIEQMTQLTHLSRATFMRLFKQVMNISPYAFLLGLRLQKSAYLLRHSNQNILTIALNCGFSSDTNFIKAFKKYYQCLPHEYRQNTAYSIH